MSLSREKQRTATIRQKLQQLKAEMRRQDEELQEVIEAAGITEAELAEASVDFAEQIDAQEPLRIETETQRVAGPAIRV